MTPHSGPCRWAKEGEEFYCIDCGRIYDPDDIKPPSTGDENSNEAADAIRPSAGTMREKVWRILADEGPRAEFQLEKRLRWPGNTIRPRLWELKKQGRIVQGPEKVKTPSGRSAWLYHAGEVENR